MKLFNTEINEGMYTYGSAEFEELRRACGFRREHISFPNGSSYYKVRNHRPAADPPVGVKLVPVYVDDLGRRTVGLQVEGTDTAYAVTIRPGVGRVKNNLGVHYFVGEGDVWEGATFKVEKVVPIWRYRVRTPQEEWAFETRVCKAGEKIPAEGYDLGIIWMFEAKGEEPYRVATPEELRMRMLKQEA